MPNEFELIEKYFLPLSGPEALSLKDDAACLTPPDGFDLVVTKDLLLEGVHFRSQDPVESIANKVLAVNVSDCVAKGATPYLYWLGLATPTPPEGDWLASFSDGLRAAQEAFGCRLAGGDTTKTKGPLTISITLCGLVPSGAMIKRSGACAGDDVYVTGTLGDGALGLWCLENNRTEFDSLVSAYRKPRPAIGVGVELAKGIASAAADVSDGLIADLGHLARASDVQINLYRDQLPLGRQANRLLTEHPDLDWMQWAGGDDYQIAFTAAVSNREKICALASSTGTQISRIGTVMKGSGVQLLDKHGEIMQVRREGYIHF